ncbi:MAG: hypothetical protein ACR2RD_09360 [Woeseiaceae bacterium]
MTAWLLATTFVGTAAASSNVPADCNKARKSALEIPASELHATTASHEFDVAPVAPEESDDIEEPLAPAQYLTPKMGTPLRQAFDDDAETDPEPRDDPKPAVGNDSQQPAIKARVPGMSDTDLARYKRHMYRRDI